MSADATANLRYLASEDEYTQLKESIDDRERPSIGKSLVSESAYDAYPDEDVNEITKVVIPNELLQKLQDGEGFLVLHTNAHYSH